MNDREAKPVTPGPVVNRRRLEQQVIAAARRLAGPARGLGAA